jgi:hypothetical protein
MCLGEEEQPVLKQNADLQLQLENIQAMLAP